MRIQSWQKVISGEQTAIHIKAGIGEGERWAYHGWTTALSIDSLGQVTTTEPSYNATNLDKFDRIYSIFNKTNKCEQYFIGQVHQVSPDYSKPNIWWRIKADGAIELDSDERRTIAKCTWLKENGFHCLKVAITGIRYDSDVRNISDEDAKAGGFDSKVDFWRAWIADHDDTYRDEFQRAAETGYFAAFGLFERPSKYYHAWVLTFKLVQP